MNKNALQFWLELLWWAVTAVVVYSVLYPIYKAMYIWPFFWTNVVFVAVLVTLARYTFMLQHTFIARQQEIKVGLMVLMFPLIFYLIGSLNEFMVYIEEKTWDPLTGHLPVQDRSGTEKYIWREMLFFGVGSIIVTPFFMGRLMLSVWRMRNRGTV